MKNTQRTLDLSPRTKLRLSEVERLIKEHRIIVPPLSRRKLVELCEDGTLETVDRRVSGKHWLVFEDSFFKWVGSLDGGD